MKQVRCDKCGRLVNGNASGDGLSLFEMSVRKKHLNPVEVYPNPGRKVIIDVCHEYLQKLFPGAAGKLGVGGLG